MTGLTLKKAHGLVSSLKSNEAPIPIPNWGYQMKDVLSNEFEMEFTQ